MLTQHLLDSLSVVGPLKQRIAKCWPRAQVSLLDVGSGAGLPGIAVAVACPELAVTCVDAVAKKASFIRQAGAELALCDFAGVHGRVEDLAARPWQVITCRAFASLETFVQITAPLLDANGLWMAMKGRVPRDEIARLPPAVEAFHVEPLIVPGVHADRCLVWMRRRDPAIA